MSEIRRFNTLDELSRTAAEAIAELSAAAIREHGRFALALSGGSTPRTLYRLLARDYREKIDWKKVHLFWGDERYVPQGDPASNYRMVEETLLTNLEIPSGNVHPIPTSFPNPAKAMEAYTMKLEEYFGFGSPEFDLVLLGLGNDGHTASIFPSTPVEETRKGLVIVTQSPIAPTIRISLAMNVLDNAQNVFFLVAGSEKQKVLNTVLADSGNPDSQYPAARVRARRLVWYVSP